MRNVTPSSPTDLGRQAKEMERFGRILLDTAKKMREAAVVFAKIGSASNGKTAELKPPRQSRLEELREYVAKHAPVSRKDVKAKSGIPAGTAGALLTKKNFDQNQDGLWIMKK